MTGQHVGTVTNYDPELHVAAVRLDDILRLGDRIAIDGSNGGVRMAIERMLCEECERRLVEPGQEVSLPVPGPVEKGSRVLMEQEAPWP